MDKNNTCKFRFHRGTLEESLKTCVLINSKIELCNIINEEFKHPKIVFKPEDISIKFYSSDNIIDWDKTYIVKIKKIGVVGFTNKLIEE